MRMIRFVTFAILILTCATALSGGLPAQEPAQARESAALDCQEATTTAAMRTCENARFEKAERELNAVYQKLSRELDAGPREKLRVAQHAWVRFRDANADFQASLAEGGTMGPLLKIGALAEMTEARTKELRKEPAQ